LPKVAVRANRTAALDYQVGRETMGEQVSIEKSTWLQVRDYFTDVRTEMRRVTWPGKQEIYSTTVMVIITTFLFGFYFWICDQTFAQTVSRLLGYFLHRG
jgi:preprotein translocase subunit SecE